MLHLFEVSKRFSLSSTPCNDERTHRFPRLDDSLFRISIHTQLSEAEVAAEAKAAKAPTANTVLKLKALHAAIYGCQKKIQGAFDRCAKLYCRLPKQKARREDYFVWRFTPGRSTLLNRQ